MADLQKDGLTYQEHLQAAAAQGSSMAKRRLTGPELPLVVAHIWEWFTELNDARQPASGVAPCAITWSDMDGFFRLTRVQPRSWEISLLRALDTVWRTPPKIEADDGH